MSELSDRMELLKSSLATMYPSRIVTRDLMDFAMRPQSDLSAGVYTLVSRGESEFTNQLGRMAAYGIQSFVIVGQIQLPESSAPSDIEDAEGVLIDEIKAFVRSDLPPGLGSLSLISWNQSAQLEHPFGWVMLQLTTSED